MLISAILLYSFFSSFFYSFSSLPAVYWFHQVLFIPLLSSVHLEVTCSISILLVFSVFGYFCTRLSPFLSTQKVGQLSWDDGRSQTKHEGRSEVFPIQAWPYLSCLMVHCPPLCVQKPRAKGSVSPN